MVSMDWLLRHRQTKEAETDRLIPNDAGACPLLDPNGKALKWHVSCFNRGGLLQFNLWRRK